MLTRILTAAVLAGSIAGVLVWGFQAVEVTPLILEAEIYEEGAAEHQDSASAQDPAWAPADGFERTAFTLLADVVTGVGFALVLAGVIALRGDPVDFRRGVLWGLAAFAAVYVSPSFGLAPELPGMAAADLHTRQVWWMGTVASGVVGLALAVFHRRVPIKIAGLVLVALPHVIGAPHVEGAGASVPAELAARFAVASLVSVGLFWIVLGGLTGHLYGRLGRG